MDSEAKVNQEHLRALAGDWCVASLDTRLAFLRQTTAEQVGELLFYVSPGDECREEPAPLPDVQSDCSGPYWSMAAPTEVGFYLVKCVSSGVVAVAEVFIGPSGRCYHANRLQNPRVFGTGAVRDSEGVFVWSKRIEEPA